MNRDAKLLQLQSLLFEFLVTMGKQKKSTIKYQKKEARASKLGKAPAHGGGRKKPKPNKNDKNRDLDDSDVESDDRALNVKNPTQEKGTFKKHQSELEQLRDTDPEFFKFLNKHDNSLLNFGQNDVDSEDEDSDVNSDLEDDVVGGSDSDGEEEEEEEGGDDSEDQDDVEYETRKRKKSGGASSKTKILLTSALLSETVKKAKSGSVPELKKLLSMFRAACIPENVEDEEDEEKGKSRFLIQTSDIYEKVMNAVLSTVYSLFKLHLEIKSATSRSALSAMSKHPKWKKMQLLVLSFFKSMLYTLDSLSENTCTVKQKDVLVYLLTCLEKYIPFLSPLPRLAKGVIKVLLNIWSIVPLEENDAEQSVVLLTRSHAFLRIRQMAIALPGAIAEECFRAMYLKFARVNRSFNELNASSVTFMAQCIAELYTTDPAMAYQQSFLYIRQLALYLRAAVLKKTAENTRQITSWQFSNCLRLWTRVICLMPDFDRGLGALVFPLSQIMFGVISHVQSPYFMPLHFHLISCLNQLAAASQRFIPTAARVMDLLSAVDFNSKATSTTAVAPNLKYLVKLPSGSLDTVVAREAIFTEAINLIRQDAEVYRFHVGVPEYLYMTTRKLRAFSKGLKVTNWRSMVHNLIGQMEDFSAFARKQRTKLNQAPMNITDFEPLLELAQLASSSSGPGVGATTKKKQKVAKQHAEPLEVALVRLNKLMSRSKMQGSSTLTGGLEGAIIPASAASAEQLQKQVSFKDNFANTKKKKEVKRARFDDDDENGHDDDNEDDYSEDEISEDPEEYSDEDEDEDSEVDKEESEEESEHEVEQKPMKRLPVDKKEVIESLKDEVGSLDWD